MHDSFSVGAGFASAANERGALYGVLFRAQSSVWIKFVLITSAAWFRQNTLRPTQRLGLRVAL